MVNQHNKRTPLSSYWLALIVPLLIFPFMINLRIFPFVAPNEEPKWAMLIICALWFGIATAWLWFKSTTALVVQKPSIPQLMLVTFTMILAYGIFIGPNQTEGLIRFSFWFSCILILSLSIWAARHDLHWKNALVWSISIGTFIFSIRYWISYFVDYSKPNYNISVLFSPIGHINFTGDVLIMLLPLLIWVLAAKTHPVLRVLNWFSVSTLATILLVASSRGALGGLVLATILITIVALKHYKDWKQLEHKKLYTLPVILVLSALITSVIVYSVLPYHYRDLARVSATAGQAASGEGKMALTPNVTQPPWVDMWVKLSPLLGARTSIFASTTAMTLDAPLLGQGTGNFAWVYPSYSNRYPDFRDALSSARTFTTNPHNVVLQIASQNGVVAVVLFMALLLYFWYRLFSTTWKTWHGWHISGLAAITAVLFDAMFNHVFFNPSSMFVFALLAGTWWGSLSYQERPQLLTINPRLAAVSAFVIIIILSIWPTRWVVSEWYVGQAMKYARLSVANEADFYQKAYVWDKQNFRAVFGMGQVAYRQKKYAESARYFEEFVRFYPYNPPALNMLGAAYMVSGQYQKAEAAFQQALDIYPDFDIVKQNLQRVQTVLRQGRAVQPPQ